MAKHFKWDVTSDQKLSELIAENVLWQDIGKSLGCKSWVAQRRAKELNLNKQPYLKDSVVITLKLPNTLYGRVRIYMARYKLTRSQAIRKILENYLKDI